MKKQELIGAACAIGILLAFFAVKPIVTLLLVGAVGYIVYLSSGWWCDRRKEREDRDRRRHDAGL